MSGLKKKLGFYSDVVLCVRRIVFKYRYAMLSVSNDVYTSGASRSPVLPSP